MKNQEIKKNHNSRKKSYWPFYFTLHYWIFSVFFTFKDVFPRFGPLIVCVGVCFGLKRIHQVFDYMPTVVSEELNELKEAIQKIPDNNPAKPTMLAKYKKDSKRILQNTT